MSMSIQTSYSAAPGIGYSGMVEGTNNDIITMKNAEASASIPFGVAVAFLRTSPGSDQDVVLPNTETTICGIVTFAQQYARAWTDKDGTFGELDSVGIIKGNLLNVMRQGRVLVTCPSGCVPGDRLYVRKDIGEASEALGTCENAADESDMIDCTSQAVWLTTAAAGGLAWLEVNFVGQ